MSRKPQKVFYKVFTVYTHDAEYLKSGMFAYRSPNSPTNNVAYSIGTWLTAPDNSRFFLFEDMNQARVFMVNNSPLYDYKHVVHRVVVKGGYATKCRGIAGVDDSTTYCFNTYRDFWNGFNTLMSKKALKASEVCAKVATQLGKCNTQYDSVFARHIKILPGEVNIHDKE